jgi:hypothetical protein
MCKAVDALLQQFPSIEADVENAQNDPDPLIEKIRRVCFALIGIQGVH